MNREGVICAGIATADVVVRPVSALPENGKLDLVDDIELHCGGCALNTAIGLTRLGVRTGLSARLGTDGFGCFVRDTLEREGVRLEGLKLVPGEKTSSTAVMVAPGGERSFLHFLGANRHYCYEDFDPALFGSYRILHLAGVLLMPALDGEPAARLLKAARDAGMVTSLDTAWDSTGRWLKAVAPMLPFTDLFLPSLEEARMISGLDAPEPVADFFLGRGVGLVALKMGERGSFFKTAKGEKGQCPIYPLEHAVDATGAGDAFAAGFLAGYHAGWELDKTIRLANAVGALAVSRMGATAGIRPLDETLRFAGLA